MGFWKTFLIFTIGFVAVSALEKPNIKPFVTSDERIRSHGYPAESHFIETSDGYVLNLFRIPYSHKLRNQNSYRPVILLQHGLFSNSDCWISSGPNDSLAYMLADAGYDVWLGNARGNIYSRKNTKISLNSSYFWRFSWHEIGTIDVAAMINFITLQTGQKSIHYGGHSQGTTVILVLLSVLPEYNTKVKSVHLLAPCAFFDNAKGRVFKTLDPLVGEPGGLWNSVLEDMELIPQNNLINRLVDTACGDEPALGAMCKNMYLWFIGDGYQNTNMSSLQILLETHPAGASSNQAIHYIQVEKSHKFRQYDWGTKRNNQLYNQATPPEYDLTNIVAPIYSYSSNNDILCRPADVDILLSKLPYVAEDYRVPEQSWNHLDFITAQQLKEVINDRVVEACNQHESEL